MIRQPLVHTLRRASACTLAFSLTATGLMSSPAAAEPGPGWEALPAETIFAVRMPHTQGFLEDLRANTLAGQRIFSAEKFDQVMQLIEENNQEEWNEMVEGLEEYGFTLDDLLTIAQNNWGMGLVASPRGDQELPRMVLLGWAEMEDADIDRIYAAIDKADAEEADNEDSRRLDYELAGLEVRQYSASEMGMDSEVSWDLPEGFENMTQEQMDAHWAEVEKKEAEAKFVKIDETHLLLTRMPGRMAMAIGFPQSGDAVREMMADGKDIDWDAATDVASVQEIFANYLTSLDGGADASFASRILAVPEAANAVGSENTLIELYADGPQLIDLLGYVIGLEEGDEAAQQYRTVMNALGFNGLGVLAGSGHLTDGAFRFDFFSEMQAPRAGLLGTLDGQTLPAEPPAWVPAGTSYFHLAYDLGKLYDVVLDVVQQLAGPEAMQQVQMGNMMVQSQIQADIPTLLRSFGTRHSIVATESQQVTFETEEYDFDTESFKTVEKTTTMQPVALVWDLAAPDVWTNIMTAAKNFAPMAGDQVELVDDEQGFTGMRMSAEGLPMGFLLGRGKLVLGVGPEVTTRVLTSINNPPAVDASLLGSALYREGDALLNYQEGIAFSIQDVGTDMINGKQQILQLLDEESGLEPGLIEQIKALFPTDEDLKASFGVSVGQIIMTESGLSYEGATAMPAAE
ncbi:MAG: hypothetical protein AAGA25_04545 [Planctomycetota bacterium]